jgi:hypothetical protein
LDHFTDRRQFRRVVVGGLIAVFFCVDVAMTGRIADNSLGPIFGITIGMVIGQLNLLATWGALGTGSALLRVPGTLLLGVLAWYGLILGCHLAVPGPGSSIQPGDAAVLGIVLLVGILVAQLPLWIAGRILRWRLVGEAIPSDRDDRQFQLRHVLLGMFFVSLVLAIGREIMPAGDRALAMDGVLGILIAALVITNLLITVPCIWATFHFSSSTLVKTTLSYPLYCAGITGLEFGSLCVFLGPPGNYGETFVTFLAMNLSQGVTVLGSLLVLRFVGLRFIRQTPDSFETKMTMADEDSPTCTERFPESH